MPLQRDDARANQVSQNPWTFTQQAGHCGPAAVIMSILDLQKGQQGLRDLEQLLYGTGLNPKNRYLGIEKSLTVEARIRRRAEFKDWRKAGYEWDQDVGVGLLLLLKGQLKAKAEPLWNECLRYSSAFERWLYSLLQGPLPPMGFKKLKDVPAQERGQTKLPFSAKNGDFALTSNAVRYLVEMVGGEVESSACGDIIDNATLESQSMMLDGARSDAVTALGKRVQKLVASKKKHGAIVGLASRDSINSKKIPIPPSPFIMAGDTYHQVLSDFKYIVHWVYVPQSIQKTGTSIFSFSKMKAQNPEDVQVWTWGAQYSIDAQALLKYIPRYWIEVSYG